MRHEFHHSSKLRQTRSDSIAQTIVARGSLSGTDTAITA
ncbi:hypothetical protein WQQ_17690 [Hydrocarboniphaga effusa AP103]|uniref:Uncharacterized protein n=1 Tax=Hydrocarboniphaga effusa AP103 TaxID=1172194 RepID=I7ZIR0_9GAMM|nr:hypothetical protein WQQ_17690 [Hydrocarboniphaga effusa AP103]